MKKYIIFIIFLVSFSKIIDTNASDPIGYLLEREKIDQAYDIYENKYIDLSTEEKIVKYEAIGLKITEYLEDFHKTFPNGRSGYRQAILEDVEEKNNSVIDTLLNSTY